MELIAVLKGTTATESGKNQNGQPWEKCNAILVTADNYQNEVAVVCLGNMVQKIHQFKPGDLLKVKMDARSNFYEGRYYTELRAWSIAPAFNIPQQQQPATAQAAPAQAAPAQAAPTQAAPAQAAPDPSQQQYAPGTPDWLK